MKKSPKLSKFSILFIAALIFMIFIPSCMLSPFYGGLIEDIKERAEIYEYFFDNIESSEISENLKAAIKNADKFHSEKDAEAAVNKFNEAAEKFRVYYFDTNNTEKISDIDLIDELYINGVKCAYDENSKTFFYTMGQTGNDTEFKFNFRVINKLKTNVFVEIYELNGDKTEYKFVPELNTEYILKAYSNESMYDYKIIFTVLPIIQIDEISHIGEDYRDCVISVTDPDFSYGSQNLNRNSNLYIETKAKIHIRGGISRSYPKKSYAVKIVDDSGANKDIALFGMRNDSDWILDAMYIDKARARNRVSTDLWNDYSSQLYYVKNVNKTQSNGTHGIYAEVFLSDEYIGLYCFTEKIDRKQLQLLKDDKKSYIYKGKSWEAPILFRRYWDYNPESDYWGGFAQKFPNPEKGGEINWKPIADFVYFGVNSTDEEFIANIEKYIDINNFVDYTLLLLMSYANDNTGKNCYWSVYDITTPGMSKIFITPWDLDATWGRSWDSNKTRPAGEYAWMDVADEHDSFLFKRLIMTNAGGFSDKLQQRWEELRDNVFSAESIINRFEEIFNLFDTSGAWYREGWKWQECKLNLETERKYIREWTLQRWEYIDNFIRNELHTVDDN